MDALHFLGVLIFQRGEIGKGVDLVRRAIQLNDRYVDAHNNLGNMLKEQGDLEGAEASYRRALEIDPDQVEALSNVGVLLRNRGNLAESRQMLERAVSLAPDMAFTHLGLGSTLAQLKEIEAATHHFRRAIELDPKLVQTYLTLGRMLSAQGNQTEAENLYRKMLDLYPGHPTATHMLAAVSGEHAPARASDAFVAHTFDQFAASFDAQLTRLEYRAPELIRDMLADWRTGRPELLDVLDLGCGTGWCGREVKPFSRKLVGVDLSEKMLALARRTGCYDALYRQEIGDFLQGATERFDAVVSADTLCYFGALDQLFAGVANLLAPDGCLVFTVEKLEGPEPFRLLSHGRYAHTSGYLEETLQQAGMVIRAAASRVLRRELGADVDGWAVLATPG